MSRKTLTRGGLRMVRAVAGPNSRFEQRARRLLGGGRRDTLQRTSGDGYVQYTGRRFVLVEPDKVAEGRRTGIVLSGGCDLATTFTAVPLLAPGLRSRLAILNHGTGSVLGAHRTDQILRTLDHPEPAGVEEVSERLRLGREYFRPLLFDSSEFSIRGHDQFGSFPKTVVILSVASDLVRVAYRHRQHGYLVDPGGFWRGRLSENILPNPEVARWFKENFESIGRIEVGQFHENLARVITEIRRRLGSHVIVYNSLVIDPGSTSHNFVISPSENLIRRREFCLALSDLSAELDFHVVDVDRILKEQGVREQVDFAHVPTSRSAPIGAEVYRILRELDVVG